jgi:hypothetical protein
MMRFESFQGNPVRPSPFTQTLKTPFGQMDPSQFYKQRDAFIQTVNDKMGRQMAGGGIYQGRGAPPKSFGAPPQFNVSQMWANAGGMVRDGWQNPLAGLYGPQR